MQPACVGAQARQRERAFARPWHGRRRVPRQRRRRCRAAVRGPGARVGQRIEAAMRATWAVAGCNTNLGILLLCAPVARAAGVAARRHHRGQPASRRSLKCWVDLDIGRCAGHLPRHCPGQPRRAGGSDGAGRAQRSQHRPARGDVARSRPRHHRAPVHRRLPRRVRDRPAATGAAVGATGLASLLDDLRGSEAYRMPSPWPQCSVPTSP